MEKSSKIPFDQREYLLEFEQVFSHPPQCNFCDEVTKMSKSLKSQKTLLTKFIIDIFSSNQRVIHIFHDYLFYYTKVPKKFQRNSFELLTEPPKSGVCLRYILRSSKIIDDPKTKQKTVIIEFPTYRTIKFGKMKGNPLNDGNLTCLIRKTPNIKQNSTTKWLFSLKKNQLNDNEVIKTPFYFDFL